MIVPANILDWPVMVRLGWVLIHSLWQGLLVAAVLAMIFAWLRRRSAAARYWASGIALATLAVLPIATFLSLDDSALNQEPAANSRPGYLMKLSGSIPRSLGRSGYEEDWETSLPSPAMILRNLLEPMLPWLVLGWVVGVGVLSVRLLAGWKEVRRLRGAGTRPVPNPWPARLVELAEKAGVRHAIELVESALVEVPTVIGWLRPVILLPACALVGLSPDQLEAILVHELAHIRRCDYLINLLQVVIETLLFYHPAVWWISARLRQERENCCDDLAVMVCGDRLGYARALTRLEEIRHELPPQAAALGMAADGGELIQRIRRVMGLPTGRPGRWQAGALLLAALLAGGVGLAMSLPHPEPASGKGGKGGISQKAPLEITITLDRPVIRPGEPVPVTLMYTNTTKQPLTLMAGEDGFPGETFLLARGEAKGIYNIPGVTPTTQRIELPPLQSWKHTIPDLAAILAQETVTHEGTLDRNPFAQPGQYTFRLRYNPTKRSGFQPVFGGSVQSNEVELTVK